MTPASGFASPEQSQMLEHFVLSIHFVQFQQTVPGLFHSRRDQQRCEARLHLLPVLPRSRLGSQNMLRRVSITLPP